MNIADPQWYQMLNRMTFIYDDLGIDNIESCVGKHLYGKDCGVGNDPRYCLYCGQWEPNKIPSADIDNSYSCGEKQ